MTVSWFKAFLFSKASGWLAVILLGAASGLLWYIQDLKIRAARYDAVEEIRPQLKALTEKVVQEIGKREDESIQAVRDADGPCLAERVPDAILDSLRGDAD
jgi:hypothetical protein